ncbi:MAG: ComF family protein [Candidatus Pacebacteria bacterium]|jgi:ComF family protein|nr:ComF family protein [Candidatus Paceibacterota bacterium]|tara:strand:- start:27283 stop:27939 length:657 start_codon:yes stop_codon:yes gene_type:complete
MNYFNRVIPAILDFFLPKSQLDRAVNAVTADVLSKKLLCGKEIENKSIYVLFDYRDEIIKHMIWSLKYRRNRQIAKVFAQMLNDFMVEELSDLNIYSNFNRPLLVPIPLSKRKFRKRGFNQTEILAKEIAAIGDNCFYTVDAGLFKKIKDTPNQTALEKKERLKNVIGAFEVSSKEKIKERNIILLDDVTTTGATLKEGRKVLLEAGAKNVLCVAVAH